MFLRSVVVDGFKSYAERTVVDGMDCRFSAITGMNGCGKSNIVDAIVFALDLGSARLMRAASARELINIHRSECSVDLVFANADKGLSPPGYEQCDEIRVTRHMDCEGRSRYRINGHVCTRGSVESMCRSMGVSSDFVVMQGQITRILGMRSSELRGMVEETAGTRSYSQERAKALDLLQRKETKLREAQEHLRKTISPFFSRLRAEKRAYEESRDCEKSRAVMAEELVSLERTVARSEHGTRVRDLEALLEAYYRDRTELEDVEEQIGRMERAGEIDVVAVRSMMDEEMVRMDAARRCCADEIVEEKRREAEGLEEIVSRVPRHSMAQLRERESMLAGEMCGRSMDKIDELESARARLSRCEARLGQVVPGGPSEFLGMGTGELARILEETQRAREEIERREVEYETMRERVPYPLIDGVHGTVDENFDMADGRYEEAIATILGSRAKFVICENDEVASRVIRESDRRISCIPLNRITSSREDRISCRATRPLDVIVFDKRLEKAFRHIFDGFWIVEDGGDAQRCCFADRVVCVTLDGTVYDPRGTVTGGRAGHRADVVRRTAVDALGERIESMRREIPSIARQQEMEEAVRMRREQDGLREEIKRERDRIAFIEGMCSTKTDVRRELEDVRREMVEAAREEGRVREAASRLDVVRREVEELAVAAESSKRAYEESARKVRECQDKLRAQECIDGCRRASEGMMESLRARRRELVESTVRGSSRIQRLHSDLGDTEGGAGSAERPSWIHRRAEEEFSIRPEVFMAERCIVDSGTIRSIEERIGELRQQVSVRVPGPEMDPSNFEMLEKNAQAIQDLEEKIAQLVQDKQEIVRSIDELAELGGRENRRAFDHINRHLGRILRYFLRDSEISVTEDFEIQVRADGWRSTLEELSGGQRSLIALCLIFSMLTFRPAPFYIFDEIDAALDLSYTQSIGEVIQSEFGGAQFIVVSLKNSMFGSANRVHEVYVENHTPRVRLIK